MIAVHHGDCREVIPTLGVTVDAVVTDPPYGLEFMGQSWDAPWVGGTSSSALFGKRERAMPGWGVSRNANCRRCGSRARGAKKCFCAEPQWDEAPNATLLRQMTGFMEWTGEWASVAYDALRPGGFLVAFGGTRTYHRMVCAIEDAGFVIQDCLMWLYGTGFPKNKAQLKPAYEPIILAYKPGGKRTMQVDECRIAVSPDDIEAARVPQPAFNSPTGHVYDFKTGEGRNGETFDMSKGRWPANICHDGSDEVVGLFPHITSTAGNPRRSHSPAGNGWRNCATGAEYNDSGSAARFFFSAKAGTQDRWGSKHPTVKPVELMRWLVQLVCPPNGTVLDPFAGSGTTAVAALATGRNAILVEREAEYIKDIKERIAFYQGGGTHSVQAKHRNRAINHGPLFAALPLTPDEDAADSLASYNEAMMAIGEHVKAGAPVPEFMLSRRRPEQS